MCWQIQIIINTFNRRKVETKSRLSQYLKMASTLAQLLELHKLQLQIQLL